MAFMKKQEYSGVYYSIETENGTTFLPADVCGILKGCENGVSYYDPREAADYSDAEDREDAERWSDWCRSVCDYVDGREIREISENVGTLYRLSAPGYMDCTDWTTDANSPEFDDDEQ